MLLDRAANPFTLEVDLRQDADLGGHGSDDGAGEVVLGPGKATFLLKELEQQGGSGPDWPFLLATPIGAREGYHRVSLHVGRGRREREG